MCQGELFTWQVTMGEAIEGIGLTKQSRDESLGLGDTGERRRAANQGRHWGEGLKEAPPTIPEPINPFSTVGLFTA
jgi:hypothetical protein